MKKIISAILIFAMMLSMVTIVQAADLSGGGYNFVCADGGRYLNVYAGKDVDGTNVCVWEKDGSPEQNYTISACGDGKYKLYPACSSSRVIDVNRGNSYNNPLKAGLNVDLWRTNDAPAQEFYITHVGGNLYKIELAALSGHVLQANSPNKNNGNVTLEKYTGASNQHWKILKNGAQVTEACTHKNISDKNEKLSMEQKNDNVHTVVKCYDKVCDDCGKTIESNVKETKTEKHTVSDKRCLECGYEVVVEEEKPIESPPFEETQVCKHEKTYTVNNSAEYGTTDKDIKAKDDEYHVGYYYADEYCSKCKALINKKIIVEEESLHAYLNGICTICLHEYYTQKPESSVISVSKTTFTPGEKISLTWTEAERATNYDIHIEKQGLDKTYRIDSGFKENSGSIVINEEGIYTLAIYPTNNAGYIRGTSVIVTVKKNTANTSYVWPSSGGYLIYVLDYYYGSTRGGAHPTKGGGAIKGAIDIATTGKALATASGTVIETKYGYNSGWGNYITLKHDDGTYSFYAHLSKINVSVNQKVSAGQAIGVIGTTGNSTGVHLHFEIWDSSKKTIYTIDAFKEKYKKQLVYDGDIVTGGSNSSAIKSWVKNNYKMSGGRWYAK